MRCRFRIYRKHVDENSRHTVEENEIDAKLANPHKTRIIAEAKIKSDKLDARILSDLLRTDLIYESYVPKREDRDKRSLVRHRITLSRTKTKLANKVHSVLDKYDYQTDLTDIFSKSGIVAEITNSSGYTSR